MIRNVLEGINGIDIYPVVSLVIFFLFFIGVIIWVSRADKSYIREMGELPLDNSMPDINKQTRKV